MILKWVRIVQYGHGIRCPGKQDHCLLIDNTMAVSIKNKWKHKNKVNI